MSFVCCRSASSGISGAKTGLKRLLNINTPILPTERRLRSRSFLLENFTQRCGTTRFPVCLIHCNHSSQKTAKTMTESTYSKVSDQEFGTFNFTSLRSFKAFKRRAEKLNIEFEAKVSESGGSFHNAIVDVDKADLRPVRMLLKPSR